MPIPGHHSPARRACGGIHTPTMKQPPSMWIFPHQQAETPLQNQHDLSILQVGSHQLQYRFFRTKKPKSHHKTNTFCPITPFCPITQKYRAFREETPGGAFGAANESALTENQSLTAYHLRTSDASHIAPCFSSNITSPLPHSRAPLRHNRHDPETIGACRTTRVKTCRVRIARMRPT